MVHKERLKFAAVAALVALAVLVLLPIQKSSVEKQVALSILRQQESLLAEFDPTSTILRASSENLRGELEGRLRAVGKGTETGELILESKDGQVVFSVYKSGTVEAHRSERPLPTKLALLPPLVALVLALVFKRVSFAMLAAAWTGVCVLTLGNPVTATTELATNYVWPVIESSFNLQILAFTFLLIGMVGVVSKMGGTRGLVNLISGFASTGRKVQVTVASMGLAIFFDDYANTVVVGSTAKPLTDRAKLSRAKLAYLVDSTSAPIAGVAIISTWIGYEVGLLDSLLGYLSAFTELPKDGYGLFFEMLPMRFYCIFALLLVFVIAASGRDFGPMLRAESRAYHLGDLGIEKDGSEIDSDVLSQETPENIPERWFNGAIPIMTVIGFIVGCIYYVGSTPHSAVFSLRSWQEIFSKASDDIGAILATGALLGVIVALGLGLAQRLFTFGTGLKALGQGMMNLVEAGAILIMAWVIKEVCDSLGTGYALLGALGDGLSPEYLPLAVFILAGAIAFSTGTSWGTMALLLPVAAPMVEALATTEIVALLTMVAVLDGAIWGDHCSPISDTTVLSSSATECGLMEHVKTQMPYAMLAMAAASLAGYGGYAWFGSLALSYGVGFGLLIGFVLLFGRRAVDVKPALVDRLSR
jgi:Na+/H+ antiporter NhaC